jgi:hypothetical protein
MKPTPLARVSRASKASLNVAGCAARAAPQLSPAGGVTITVAARCRHQPTNPMNVFNGMPTHALLVHFMVTLIPLTALLEITRALWPTARRGQLVWPTLIVAIVISALTPITTNAGGWLYDLKRNPDLILRARRAGRRNDLFWRNH